MKILLIIPYFQKKRAVSFINFGFPYIFLCLASVTPERHCLEFVDERFEDINFKKHYDLVGMSVYTANSYRAYQLAEKFRAKGTTVVLGGYHPSVLPEEAKQHSDSVVIGEAEEIWPRLLDDFENGRLKPFYKQEKPVDINSFKVIRQPLLEKGSMRGSIHTARGCPFGCEFCAITNYQRTFRTKSIKGVIEELISIPQKNIFIQDPAMTIDVKRTKKLFKEIIDSNINKRFLCQGTVNVLSKDRDLLRLSSEAGCIEWFAGFESFSKKNISDICKYTNDIKKYKNVVKNVHDYGMLMTGAFIVGLDYDTKQTFRDFVDNTRKIDLDFAGFNMLTPYPGTPLYQRFEQQGRILTRDWSKYDGQNVVYAPKNFSPQDLLNGYHSIRKEYFSYFNDSKRIIKSLRFGPYRSFQMMLKHLPGL